MTQKEIVIDYFNSNGNKPTHYSKVSEDTGILVDSMRRILGMGVHDNSRLLDKWNSKCSVTGVGITKILIGSHIVPWRESNDDERLDVDNGILLTPNLDGLFDKYLITFDDDGKIVFSKKIDINELTILGINNEMKISSVNSRMKNYLKRHRERFYEQEK